MKLGARILKTGLAITVAIYSAMLLELPSPAFAGIAAIFAIQPSIYRSYLTMLVQVKANVVGAFIAVFMGVVFGNNPIVIGFTAVLVIMAALRLKLEGNISVALVTVVAIMEYTSDEFIFFALARFSSIFVGILSAFFVNMIFMPPKYEVKLFRNINSLTEEIIKWIRLYLRGTVEYSALKTEIDKLKKPINKLNETYNLYKEERSLFKKDTMERTRKLVLFKNLLLLNNTTFTLLKKLHRVENELHHMPKDFQELFRSELECLLTFHEHLMMKTIGKSNPSNDLEIINEVCHGKLELLKRYLKFPVNNLETDEELYWIHILPVVSGMLEYAEQLDHLDKLLHSFHNYHKEDANIKTADSIIQEQ
ncbi:MAG: aromatic acid exporter family protein [Bacillales bacterium]|jgi:uncharacterized membrane protein YgaE (UPF0421/DUF939 family)|nr:aromatic acid exporter family protein [Bacillales bacterium]